MGQEQAIHFLDHAVQVAIGLRAQGINRPVKLYWPRAEDFTHGQYRPMAVMRVRIGMNASGVPTAYFMRHVSQSPLKQRNLFFGAEGDNVDGAIDTPYAIANKRVEYARLDTVKVPVSEFVRTKFTATQLPNWSWRDTSPVPPKM